MNVRILHHNDLDGYVAGTIVRQRYPDAVCYSVNYDNPELLPDRSEIGKGDRVYMVDYTVDDHDLMEWMVRNVDLVWIDHHATSIEKERRYGWESVRGIRRNGLCGAELCWKWFHRGKPIPRFVRMVGNYDVFRYASSRPKFHEGTVIPFAMGAASRFSRIKPCNFGKPGFMFDRPEDFMDDSLVDELVSDGKIVYDYQREHGILENPCNCFVRKIWGLRVLCMNSCGRGSTQFTIPGTWNPDNHDAMLIYYYNGVKWAYGLYSEKPEFDMGKIAMEHGGGGHRGAAGFNSDELIEELR